MKILIIGKTGQLGSALIQDASSLDAKFKIFAPDKQTVNVRNAKSFLAAVKKFNPDVVINTAAFHNVPECEVKPLKAFELNCVAVRNMAEICAEFGAVFVTFSTDYVFDGAKGKPYSESDVPCPLQYYGLSRLAGEFAARMHAPEKTFIIRTCGLYGLQGARSKGGNFVDGRIRDAVRNKNKTIEMSHDQTISPTYADDLSKAVLQLICHTEKKPGTYHLVNQGYCTWYEFTKEIYRLLDLRVNLVPVDRKGMTGKMRRPLFSALKNTKAARMGIRLPHWKNALARYLQIKYA